MAMNKTAKEKKTIKSFDYQWNNLQNAKNLLTDEKWRDNVDSYILDELQVSREWIKGKTVIDVGCGGGRWSYGFVKLGCKVTSTDISEGPCRFTKENVPEAEVVMCDLFELPSKVSEKKFDIVWCWGVIHHTGDPKSAFDTLVKLMHDESLLHVYVYSFDRGFRVRILRQLIRLVSFKNRERAINVLLRVGILHGDVHEWFDALSPEINYEIPESTLKKWFLLNGLKYKMYTPKWAKNSRDLFATGILTH